jgi:hypothetical protein
MPLEDGFDVRSLVTRGDEEAARVLADTRVVARLDLEPRDAAAIGALADEAASSREAIGAA